MTKKIKNHQLIDGRNKVRDREKFNRALTGRTISSINLPKLVLKPNDDPRGCFDEEDPRVKLKRTFGAGGGYAITKKKCIVPLLSKVGFDW